MTRRRIATCVCRLLGGHAHDSASHADGREAGLTLVEMIVALALGAMVVGFLAQGTGLLRHFARLGRIVSAQDETLATRDHLRRTIESAAGRQGATQRDALAGVVDTAVFTVPGDRLLETAGPVRITLAAVAEGRTVSLVETRSPVAEPGGKGRTRRLVTGASQVQFSYFGATSGAGPVWLPEWTDPGTGPSLLRIDVAFPRGDARQWPLFIVFMPSGGSAAAPRNGPPKAEPGAPGRPG